MTVPPLVIFLQKKRLSVQVRSGKNVQDLLEKLRQEVVPSVDALLQSQVQLESGRRRRVAVNNAEPPVVVAALEVDVDGAALEAAQFGFRHGVDVLRQSGGEVRRQEDFAAGEVRPLGLLQLLGEALAERLYRQRLAGVDDDFAF